MLDLSKLIALVESKTVMVGGAAVVVTLPSSGVLTALRGGLPVAPVVYEKDPAGGGEYKAVRTAEGEAEARADQLRFGLLEAAAAVGQAFDLVVEYPAGWRGQDVPMKKITVKGVKASDCVGDACLARAWAAVCLEEFGKLPDAVIRPIREAVQELHLKVAGGAAGKSLPVGPA